jgi:hypothetical protein
VRDLERALALPRAVVAWPTPNGVGTAEVLDGDVDAARILTFPAGDAPAALDTTAAESQTGAAPVSGIESDVDRRAGLNMVAGAGRITRSSTVPQAIRTNSSTLGSF